jgi:hypothetical protein
MLSDVVVETVAGMADVPADGANAGFEIFGAYGFAVAVGVGPGIYCC